MKPLNTHDCRILNARLAGKDEDATLILRNGSVCGVFAQASVDGVTFDHVNIATFDGKHFVYPVSVLASPTLFYWNEFEELWFPRHGQEVRNYLAKQAITPNKN